MMVRRIVPCAMTFIILPLIQPGQGFKHMYDNHMLAKPHTKLLDLTY